jgi:hypothetical protein
MRPTAVIVFERLFFLTILLGVLQDVIGSDQIAGKSSAPFMVFVQVFTVVVIVSLVLFVSRRRSITAKWILVVISVLGIPAMWGVFASGNLHGSSIISLIQGILQIIALGMLFIPSSRSWLSGTTHGRIAA